MLAPATSTRRRRPQHPPSPEEEEEMVADACSLPDEIERSPFALPSEEEIFRMRGETTSSSSALKKSLGGTKGARRQKIWEREVAGATGRSSIVSLGRSSRTLRAAGMAATASSAAGQSVGMGGTQQRHVAPWRQEDSMAEFVAKKKEMFLVQMSLDTKRDEIRKLEEKARMKEEALRKSEEMLEEDALRFDTFLKENDKKAHDAIKRAERETKLRTDKMIEIKKLNQQIQLVQSDMNKHRESLEDCLRYKAFLHSLTPQSYIDQQAAIKRERQQERRKRRFEVNKKAWEVERRRISEAEALEQQQQDEGGGAAGGGGDKAGEKKRKGGKDRSSLQQQQQQDVPKVPPKLESIPLTSSGEDMPMYFTDPQQLLDIFQTLEEQNLYLIQISQETEHAVDELRQNFRETQRAMDAKSQALSESIQQLEAAIAAEQAKADQLRKRIDASAGDTLDKQEDLLQQLHGKVKDVYERCGFDAVSNPTTLFMLSDLEARLEDLLSATRKMPEDYVIKAEKEKEKRRREKKRAEQQALHEQMQEERNRKAIERSLQGPKKRTGRKVMERIRQSRRTVRETQEESQEEDLDEIKHLS